MITRYIHDTKTAHCVAIAQTDMGGVAETYVQNRSWRHNDELAFTRVAEGDDARSEINAWRRDCPHPRRAIWGVDY